MKLSAPGGPRQPRPPRELELPEESPGFDDDIEFPVDVDVDSVIPDEERVIDLPS
ncbi:MAG: hypothetical protein V4731_01270 [Pseudomonadota bacterium]